VSLVWVGLAVMCAVPATLAAYVAVMYAYLRFRYWPAVARVFEERPLFVIPRGEPLPGAEEVRFPTTDGLRLHGCYLRGQGARRGVVLFGLEYGSTCWSCRGYVEPLLAAGFDVFAYEPRNQGASDALPGYEPLQWVTQFDLDDARAALAHLKGRPDADPRGVGLFGVSKGAGAGLLAAAEDPYVRCVLTDGAFAAYTTLVPYMRQWFCIYYNRPYAQQIIPDWFLGGIGLAAMRIVGRRRGCRFLHLEGALRRLAGRPLLMIHGQADSYIKTDMARALFARAAEPKELWVVPGARHNQALHAAGDEYRRRVRAFFERHLAGG
jgi:dipeptidyl aminopeptidase/acylaminoacyl peptidase